jgi:cytochrome c oxidase cbb3-type subunit III
MSEPTQPHPNEPKRGTFAGRKGEIIIRQHEYDGIQEYDQKLPNWWLFTFYGAIAWFLIHWVLFYNAGAIPTDHQRVSGKIAAVEQKRQAEREATEKSLDDAALLAMAKDPAITTAGEATFSVTCVACHGADLSATMDVGGTKIPLPGLSLKDKQWKFGGKPMDLYKLVRDGSPPESDGHNGARMQAWGATLGTTKVTEVVAYVISQLDEFK